VTHASEVKRQGTKRKNSEENCKSEIFKTEECKEVDREGETKTKSTGKGCKEIYSKSEDLSRQGKDKGARKDDREVGDGWKADGGHVGGVFPTPGAGTQASDLGCS
jgi:hypothetical protein